MSWRRLSADVSLVAMEACYLFVLGNLLAGVVGGRGPGFAGVLVATFGGFWLSRLLARFDLPGRYLALLGSFLALLSLWLLASLQYGVDGTAFDLTGFLDLARDPQRTVDAHASQVAGIAVLGATWLRASLVGMRPPADYRGVLRSFAFGLGIVVIGLSLGRAAASSRAIDAAALPFFVAGLFALAIAHLAQSEHIQSDSWRGPWLVVMGGTAAVFAVAGLAIGLVPLDALNFVLAPIGSLLLAIIDVLVYLIALPIALAVNWLLSRALGGNRTLFRPNLQMASQAARNLQRPEHRGALALAAIFVAKALLFVAITGGAIAIIWWTYQKLRRRTSDGTEIHESLQTEIDFRGDLAGLLSGLRNRFRRPHRIDEPSLPPRVLVVRRLYLRLLRRASADGLERPAAATPLEFAPALESHFDSREADIVSRRFSAGRYGRIEPTSEELSELEHAVKKLQG